MTQLAGGLTGGVLLRSRVCYCIRACQRGQHVPRNMGYNDAGCGAHKAHNGSLQPHDAPLPPPPFLQAPSRPAPMHMHHAPRVGPAASAPLQGPGPMPGPGMQQCHGHQMPASHQIPGLREGAVFMETDGTSQIPAGPGQLQLHVQQPGYIRESMGETC